MKSLSYKHTVAACLIGAFCQAILCNFPSLLFLTFSSQYGIPLGQLTLIVTVNFSVQLMTDLAASVFADKLGYRPCLVASHIFSALGLVFMVTLPEIIPGVGGFIISAVAFGIGGGLIEVLASPAIEACPLKNKTGMMSFLHSCYCWGVVAVVLLSSVFFAVFGIENWKIMTLLWAIIPLLNGVYLSFVPIYTLPRSADIKAGDKKPRSVFSIGVFWVFLLMMLCSGAGEQAVFQWSSTFIEASLGVDKTLGDLIGVCGFAAMMGIGRVLYGKMSSRLPKKPILMICAALSIVNYLLIALAPVPWVGLLGVAFCGMTVGIFWPATLSVASENMPYTTTATFALLALAGDVGCTSGPTLVGLIADGFGGHFSIAILIAMIFPITLFIVSSVLKIKKSTKCSQTDTGTVRSI